MIRGLRPQQSGFTIIEVIIFLTVSIAIVGGAMALFSTRIPRTQFTQAVTELDLKIRDTANQVVNGFYPNTNNITCNGVSVAGGSNEQGTNADCIFLGRAIQFGPAEEGCSSGGGINCDEIKIYTLYGRSRMGSPPRQTENLSEAQPRFMNTAVIAPEVYTTGYGLYLTKVLTNTPPTPTGGVTFLQTFGAPSVSLGGPSGASQVEMRLIDSSLGMTEGAFTSSSGGVYNPVSSRLSGANPARGITLCLRSGTTTDQYATIVVGDGGRPLTTRVSILGETEWLAICG